MNAGGRQLWGRLILIVVCWCWSCRHCWSNSSPTDRIPWASPAPAGHYRVYVADWGYHTSIILQQPANWQLGPLGTERAPFVEFAWGDRRFYMDGNHRPDVVFAAVFLRTDSVRYVESWRDDPARIGRPRGLYVRDIDAAQLTSLAEDVEGALRRTDSLVRPAAFPQTPQDLGRFYPAHGQYLWWMDCNRWTVDRLTDVHLARGGRGVILSGQVPGRLIGFVRVK
jgi:hypothetical protein